MDPADADLNPSPQLFPRFAHEQLTIEIPAFLHEALTAANLHPHDLGHSIHDLTIIGHIVDIIVHHRLDVFANQLVEYLDSKLGSNSSNLDIQTFQDQLKQQTVQLNRMEQKMSDAATALSDLATAVAGIGANITDVGNRVSTDLKALKDEISVLQGGGSKTISDLIAGIESNVSSLKTMSDSLATIDPAAPQPPAPAPPGPVTPGNNPGPNPAPDPGPVPNPAPAGITGPKPPWGR